MNTAFRLTLLLLLLPHRAVLNAQDCSLSYVDPVFAVQAEYDVYYGTAPRYNGAMQDLYLNLFKPLGDGQVERPLIVLIHGGGFTGGHRNDLNAQAMDLASKGWAAATISYRLDFYGTWLFSSPWAYDPAEVIRAAYRAQQDTRGAVRFLKARSVQDSTSTENIFLMGYSAGAIAALHAAFVDDPSEKPASCGAIGNVVHFLNSYPRPDLGPYQGILNINGESDQVKGVVSNYGGLLDTNLISAPLDPALYMYHQTGDPVVGCYHQQGLWGMPLGVGGNYPWLYGSCVTDQHITQNIGPDSLRYHYTEHVGNQHAIHDPAGILLEELQFLRGQVCPESALQVAVRAFLEGPYDAGTGLMNDGLRALGGFPMVEPYSALGYTHQGGGGEFVFPQVLTTSGPDAIVDWVVVELRDALDPTVVVASSSALLQRDGDVVRTDGTSALAFELAPGPYHVAVRHRNHLGAMTDATVALGPTPAVVDMTSSLTGTYGTDARRSITGLFPARALWAGDVRFDGNVKYTGADNDRDAVLTAVGGVVPTNTGSGYHQADVDLNGEVKYTGSGNDRDVILENVGGVVPTNVRMEQLP